MGNLVGRPVCTQDDSDDIVPHEVQTTEQVEGNTEREVVSILTDMDKILDCQMETNHPDSNNVVPKHYLVKWKGLSYLHCSWVPMEEFLKAYRSSPYFKTRVNKFHSKMESIGNSGYDFVAIPPEWTTVDRIIACRGEDDHEKEYLVKFKELCYDKCYWESESNISTFQNEIQRFNDINSGHRRDKYVDNERNHEDFRQFDHTPEFITGSLHPYQLEGLNFLRYSWSNRTHVVLADEIGLGKKIQSIAFLASLFEENMAPYLIVAPLSTLRNWEKEFATWAPHMNVVVYGGNSHARTVIREHEFYFTEGHNTMSGISEESNQDRTKFDVILTSYEMINVDTEVFKQFKWKCMIVDEGQRMKNKNSKLFNSLKQYMSEHRVLLTGTPLQNNLVKLFKLMQFLDVGKFASVEVFQDQFKDINQEEQISKLHTMVAPHLLRRLKEDVLKDVTPKKEVIVHVDLSSQQKEMYKSIMIRSYKTLPKRVQLPHVLKELRKICQHPYMVEGVKKEIEDQNEAFKQLVESSGKLQLLDQMMVKLREQGHRVLIYSQFQHMLNLLEVYCRHKNWYYERIDGKVTGPDKQARIDRFNAENSNRFCFLLSTKVRGVGINLPTADTVFIYDSDWNPHADLQAMATAHRLDQTEKVMIYRLISHGTVEEKMVMISKNKMLQEHLGVEELKTPILSQKELDDIIRYGSKELFSKEDGEAGMFGNFHYDDADIDKLLDRDRVDDEEVLMDNERAFQLANSEYYIDDNEAEAAALEEAQAIQNKSPAGRSDRANYWKDLLKDKYEVNQAEELSALGKRKRNCKQMFEDDELACLEASSDDDEEAEPTGREAGNQMTKRTYRRTYRRTDRRTHDNSGPKPLTGGGDRSSRIKVFGLNESQRKVFLKTLMRYGVGNYDWMNFVDPLKMRTYDQIQNYGILFLKHIIKDTEDNNSPTFSDLVPIQGLGRGDIIDRIALMMLIQKKVKLMEEDPRRPLFPDRITQRFVALRRVLKYWNMEHDKMLLRAVYKNGFGKWINIINDKEFELDKIICKHKNVPYTSLIPANSYQRDPQRRLGDFVRERFEYLDLAMTLELIEECYYRRFHQLLPMNDESYNILYDEFLQTFVIENITRNLSAIGALIGRGSN